MPDCDHCDRSFEDEEAYLAHLADEHEGELGRIEQRRVDNFRDDDSRSSIVVYGAALLGAIAIVGLAYVLVGSGGSEQSIPEPGEYGTAHDHGTIEVLIDGEELDFTDREFTKQDRKFHFHGDDPVWHTHARDITVAYAMETLGIDVTEDTVTYENTTYRDDDPGTTVIVEVNGEPVDPERYVLDGVADPAQADLGDHIRIVVETE